MSSHLSSGALLGPYELLLPLPRTGAAQVWIARLVGAGGFRTRLALKTIPRAYFDDEPTEQLLLEQVALAARIRHPNLVETLDLGEQDDTLYVAMEWVDGEPLRAALDLAIPQGGVPLPLAVNIAGQLCRGLHAIHEHCDADGAPLGAVHGHISLQNLLLAHNGTIKLGDFGIATAMDRLSFLTAANQRNHKLTFAAPEQLSALPVDRRADVFSVGTLLYQLMTSQHPFEGGDVRATLNNICSNQPALPLAASYPTELREVVLKALRKAPEERWSSALELFSALEGAMPDCFHTTCDQTLAAYLETLCSARKLGFHARIHAVELQQDRRRGSLPPGPASLHPSLRAVSMDAAVETVVEPVSSRTAALSPVVGRFSVARLRRVSPLMIALPASFLLSLGLWRWAGTSEVENSPGRTLASQALPAPAASILPPSAPAPTATLAPPSPPAAPVSSGQGLPPPVQIESLALAPRARSSAIPAPRRVAPVPRPPAPRAPLAASSAPRPEPAATPVRANPWDASTFGGRH